MSLSLMLTVILTISMTIVVLSSLQSSANAIVVNNTEFSVNVPDNWAYKDASNPAASLFGADSPLGKLLAGQPRIELIPTEFSNFLVNTSKELSGKAIQNGGAYSVMTLDTDYPYRNIPLEAYTQNNIQSSPVKVFSQQNATISGENAVKILRSPRDNSTNVQVLEYDTVHNGKPYFIQYVANVKDFQKYLPQFEQMVKTFKFTR